MVEAGGVEPPSETASFQLLRACSVFESRLQAHRQTGPLEDQHPRFVKTRAPGCSAPGRIC